MEQFEFGKGVVNVGYGTIDGAPFFAIDRQEVPRPLGTILTPDDGPLTDAVALLYFTKRADVDWLIQELTDFRDEHFKENQSEQKQT